MLLPYTQPLALTHEPDLNNTISHASVSNTQPLANVSNTQPLAIEMEPIECKYCEKPTKFKTLIRLEKHIKRFHSDWNKRDSKRKREGEEEVFPKKGKWDWE